MYSVEDFLITVYVSLRVGMASKGKLHLPEKHGAV
jgi:hypothetical protein